jgi:peptidoglycan/xylan/chitin deacetylase (PgdA/CDA1 family)
LETNARNDRKVFIGFQLLLIILIFGLISIIYKTNDKIKDKQLNYLNMKIKYENNNSTIKELNIKKNELLDIYNNKQSNNYYKEEFFKKVLELENKIIAKETNVKIAYVTFDDGPYYNTYKVLDILDKYNIKATFFTTSINGTYCYDKKTYNCLELYKEYAKRGHTIANHTYTHAIRKGLYASVDSFIRALKKQEERVKELSGGYVTNIVRFPGGSRSSGKLKNKIIAELKKLNYGWVDWNGFDGDGGMLKSKTEAWKNMKASIDEPIEVILFHDYSKITTSLLPEFIEFLQNKGYILLPLFYESNMIHK